MQAILFQISLGKRRQLLIADHKFAAVIMASHDPKAVEKFKKIYNMRDGNFV